MIVTRLYGRESSQAEAHLAQALPPASTPRGRNYGVGIQTDCKQRHG